MLWWEATLDLQCCINCLYHNFVLNYEYHCSSHCSVIVDISHYRVNFGNYEPSVFPDWPSPLSPVKSRKGCILKRVYFFLGNSCFIIILLSKPLQMRYIWGREGFHICLQCPFTLSQLASVVQHDFWFLDKFSHSHQLHKHDTYNFLKYSKL